MSRSGRIRTHSAVCVCFVALGLVAVSADDNWPRFRGSDGGVAADHPALPERWSTTENVVWSTAIPGRAWSSPIVWGDHVIVTTAVNTGEADALRPVADYISRSNGGTMTFRDLATSRAPHRWLVYDIDVTTGRVRWEREVKAATPSQTRHLKNSYASETPVTDGERIYAYFGDVGLFALDMEGHVLWSAPIDPVKMQDGFGHAKSPVVDERNVYIVNDNEERSFIAAFDKRTGKEAWRHDRQEASNWTTPLVWTTSQRTEIVTAATKAVRSYGTDGTLLWQLTGMSTFDVPSPVVANGLLYIMSGYPTSALKPVYAIRPGARGDISLKPDQTSSDSIAWSNPSIGTFHPSPLVYRGCFYVLHDRGFLTCHDPATGAAVFPRQRITTDAVAFSASPWAYNGKVFAISEEGDTYVLEAGPTLKLLGKNSLGEMTLATPAVARGSLFVRTASKLYRISTAR